VRRRIGGRVGAGLKTSTCIDLDIVVQESAGELAPGPQTSVDLESEVDSIMAG